MKAPRFTPALVWLMISPLALRAELVNGIKAIIHDSVVTYEDVEAFSSAAADSLVRDYRSQPEALRKKMDDLRAESLEKLLDRQLILHDFKTAGYNLPESILDDLVQEHIQDSFHGDRVTMMKTLQERGITSEKFRQQIREQFIIRALREKNISSEIIISPHKVESYYQAHVEQFKVEDEVKLRMIVLNKKKEAGESQTRKLADEVLAKLKEGAAFQDVADEVADVYSHSSRKDGGNWGWVERSVLRKELAEAAFALKAGQLSDVIETPDACYVMLVEDVRGNHFKPLSEVRDKIERDFLTEERARLEKQWMDKLKKKTFVRYF